MNEDYLDIKDTMAYSYSEDLDIYRLKVKDKKNSKFLELPNEKLNDNFIEIKGISVY